MTRNGPRLELIESNILFHIIAFMCKVSVLSGVRLQIEKQKVMTFLLGILIVPFILH